MMEKIYEDYNDCELIHVHVSGLTNLAKALTLDAIDFCDNESYFSWLDNNNNEYWCDCILNTLYDDDLPVVYRSAEYELKLEKNNMVIEFTATFKMVNDEPTLENLEVSMVRTLDAWINL
jgi:hypothetical protein